VLPARRGTALRRFIAAVPVVAAVTGLGAVLVVTVRYERDRSGHVARGDFGRWLNGHFRDRVGGAGLTRVARLPGSVRLARGLRVAGARRVPGAARAAGRRGGR